MKVQKNHKKCPCLLICRKIVVLGPNSPASRSLSKILATRMIQTQLLHWLRLLLVATLPPNSPKSTFAKLNLFLPICNNVFFVFQDFSLQDLHKSAHSRPVGRAVTHSSSSCWSSGYAEKDTLPVGGNAGGVCWQKTCKRTCNQYLNCKILHVGTLWQP